MAKRKIKFAPVHPKGNFWTIIASKVNWNLFIKTVGAIALAWLGINQYMVRDSLDKGVETVQKTAIADSAKVIVDSSYRVEQRKYRADMKAIALQSLKNDSLIMNKLGIK